MNKKVLLTIGFFALAFAGVFFFSQGSEEKEAAFITKAPLPKMPEPKSNPQTPSFDKKKAREVLRDEAMPMGATSFTGPRPLSEEELDKMDAQLDKFEKGWDDRVEKLFLTELNLQKVDFEDYKLMRKGYEEDRLEAFEEFHERMAKEKGLHYTYSPTEEMLQFEGKLKKEYLDTFRRRFGEDAFVKYFNALEAYNAKMRQEGDPDLGILSIDF